MLKKSVIFVLLFLFSIVNVRQTVHADSTSIAMGFDVDSTQYGSVKDYRYTSAYSYHSVNGVQYAVGYQKLKSACYEDQSDSDWVLVIIQSTCEPKDTKIPSGIFNIKTTWNSQADYQIIYSDIDNSSIGFGYGAYITSTNFLMEQPSPRDEPNTTVYTASIDVGKEVKASGQVTFEDNELDLYYYHSASDNIFNTKYKYSPSSFGFDTSYMNGLSYNIGAYLVDMSVGNSSNAGDFVNTVKLTTQFFISHGQSIYIFNKNIYVTTYY
ncbi:MAG: hypothetical protein JXR64_13735 [Spirochaetales bacterium]|nr:hypothetical protein [Spirochaetales bacterium]